MAHNYIMLTATPARLERSISQGRNVLIQGLHGTGKTSMVRAVCEKLGYKVLTFSAATADPTMTVVGMPYLVDGDGDKENDKEFSTKKLSFAPAWDLSEYDVIFIDELNRDLTSMMANAVMELVVDHSINGVKLPRLKSVVACINPPSAGNEYGMDYHVTELDPATLDRFHAIYTIEHNIDGDVVSERLKEEYGIDYRETVAHMRSFMSSLPQNSGTDSDKVADSYLSPRRATEMLCALAAVKDVQSEEFDDVVLEFTGYLKASNFAHNALIKALKTKMASDRKAHERAKLSNKDREARNIDRAELRRLSESPFTTHFLSASFAIQHGGEKMARDIFLKFVRSCAIEVANQPDDSSKTFRMSGAFDFATTPEVGLIALCDKHGVDTSFLNEALPSRSLNKLNATHGERPLTEYEAFLANKLWDKISDYYKEHNGKAHTD